MLFCQVVAREERYAGDIGQFHLLPVLLDRRHFNGVTQTIAQRKRGFYVPGVRDVHVVIADRALIEHGGSRRVESQIWSASCIQLLGLPGDTENLSVEGVIVPDLRCWQIGRLVLRRIRHSSRRGADIVDGRILDKAAIVVAEVIVVIVLIDAAKLYEVVPHDFW